MSDQEPETPVRKRGEAPPEGGPSTTILLDIYQDVGELKGKVDILLEDREHAAEDRRLIADRLGKVEVTQATFTAFMERVEPIIAKTSKWLANIGAGWWALASIGALLFAALGFGVSRGVSWIMDHLQWKP